MSKLKQPELNLSGNISGHFKNFEVHFNNYCIQADYRDLAKDPMTTPADHYKKPQLEIAALPDKALQVIRYTTEPQIAARDKNEPWIWVEKLHLHYTGSMGSSLMADQIKFWGL